MRPGTPANRIPGDWRLIGWCEGCGTVEDPYPGRGVTCDGDCETPLGRPAHYYRRRLYRCEEHNWYFDSPPQDHEYCEIGYAE